MPPSTIDDQAAPTVPPPVAKTVSCSWRRASSATAGELLSRDGAQAVGFLDAGEVVQVLAAPHGAVRARSRRVSMP